MLIVLISSETRFFLFFSVCGCKGTTANRNWRRNEWNNVITHMNNIFFSTKLCLFLRRIHEFSRKLFAIFHFLTFFLYLISLRTPTHTHTQLGTRLIINLRLFSLQQANRCSSQSLPFAVAPTSSAAKPAEHMLHTSNSNTWKAN